jgi:CelD/BcsL family acetyltransferase involved in cellulose biosynthesis
MAAVEAEPVAEAVSGGVEIIERLASEWRALCLEGPCDQPFFRPEWVAAYARAFAPGKKLLALTARVDGRLRAVLPLIKEWSLFHGLPIRMLRSAANVHSCRFDVVHGASQDVHTGSLAIWRLLKQSRGWDVIELGNAPQGGGSESLLSSARLDGYLTAQWEMSPSPYIRLPEGKASPEKERSLCASKFRSKLRRKWRKLEGLGKVRFTGITEVNASDLERFYQLERSGWKGRKGTAIACDAMTRQFYDEVARWAAKFGHLSLYTLECGDRAIAMQLCMIYGGRCFVLKSAYDEAFGEYSPGHLITHEILSHAVTRGLIEYDFLPPQMEWKSRWTKAARAQNSCYIFRPDLAGHALHFWKFHVMRAARRLKRKLSQPQSPAVGKGQEQENYPSRFATPATSPESRIEAPRGVDAIDALRRYANFSINLFVQLCVTAAGQMFWQAAYGG